MSRLFLVRHAQASFLSEDYDRLSERGREQAGCLGRAFAERGIRPTRVVSGPRLRQRDTAGLFLEAVSQDSPQGSAEVIASLDEYPADDVLAALGPWLGDSPESSSLLRQLNEGTDLRQRGRALESLLQRALLHWAESAPPLDGVDSFAAFQSRVAGGLEGLVSSSEPGQCIVAVSSAGTIGAIVGCVLGTDARRTLELGFTLENASVTELLFSPGRLGLARYNDVAHLPEALQTRR